MKKRNALGIAGLALAFFLILSGCQQPEALSSDATLARVTVAGVDAVSLGTPSEDWEEAVAHSGHIYLAATQFVDAEVSAAASADGAAVFFSQVKPGVLPNFVEDEVFTFETNDVLFVEVFSANLDAFLIYAIQIHKKTPVISDISLGGRSATGGAQLNGIPIQQFGTGMGTPGSAWNDSAIVEGSVWFGASQEGSSLALSVTPEDPGTSFQYAVVSAAAADPTTSFENPPDPFNISVSNGSYLYLKSVSGDAEHGETVYYKVKLTAKRDDRSLASVSINGVPFGIGQMGTHSFPGSEAWGAYSNGAELATDGTGYKAINTTLQTKDAPIVVTVAPTDYSLDILYGHTATERDYTVDFGSSATLGLLPTNEWIGLEVTSELGEKGWYKFRVYVGRPENIVNAITIPGGAGAVTLPAPNTAVTGTAASAYTMAAAGPWSPTVTVSGLSGGAQVAYAIAASANTNITNWDNTTGVFTDIISAQYVVIRVVSENAQNTNFYKVRLLYGSDIAALNSIDIPGVSGSITVPAPNTAVTGTTATTYTMTGPGPWSPAVTVGLGEANEQIAYAVAAAANANITNWSNTTGILENVVSAQYVVIRVISQDNTLTNYYKIRLIYGNSGAVLASLSVGGVFATLGTAQTAAPAAEPSVAVRGAITLTTAQLAGTAIPVLNSDPGNNGATVAYGRGYMYDYTDPWKGTVTPTWSAPVSYTPDIPATIETGNYLVVRVTSEDGTNVLYHNILVTIPE